MAKKVIKRVLILICMTLLIVSSSAVVLSFLNKEEPYTFSVSGYVIADGVPLSDATVSCGEATTTTDKNGYYQFFVLKNAVQISVEKDGYLVEGNMITASDNMTDVNFFAYKYFDSTGVIKNNDAVIPYATIVATSKAGTYTTTANEFGEFYLPKLAGEVTINASSEGYTFFDRTFDIYSEELVINGTTSVSGIINVDKAIESADFVVKHNDKEIDISSENTFTSDNVSVGDTISIFSEKYYIETNTFTVTKENEEITFDCKIKYDISGNVHSGNVALEEVTISAMGYNTTTDENGNFLLAGLYGDVDISASFENFTFDNITVNCDTSSVDFVGKFSLNGKVFTDDNNLNGITVNSTVINNKGEFTLNDIQLNDVITVNADDYYAESKSIVINSVEDINIYLQRLYSLDIKVGYRTHTFENLIVSMGTSEYVVNENKLTINNLYGTNSFTLSCEGFKFEEEYTSDYSNAQFNITPYKYYNLSGIVRSGDIRLENALVQISDKSTTTDVDGNFYIENLYLPDETTITCNGYNAYTINTSVDSCIFDINLSYNISGNVICGDNSVSGVVVKVNDTACTTNYLGHFQFQNLYGTNVIEFSKDYYNFSNQTITVSENLEINCTYNLIGQVYNGEGAIANLPIILIDVETMEKEYDMTDSQGNYSFSYLNREYILIYDTNTNLALKPSSYVVSNGGQFDFADNGYCIGGFVKSGNVPVRDVVVTAGNLQTTTDENGYYKFDLITKPTTLVLQKDGYTFENNALAIDESYNERNDVNFGASYKITGTISSGITTMEGVRVTAQGIEALTDKNGYYSIDGVVGETTIIAELEGYTFEGNTTTSECTSIDMQAYYSATIQISSGDINVDDAVIRVNGNEITTNELGVATLEHIQIGNKFTVNKSNFNFLSEYTLEGYTTDVINISASYNLNGVASSGNVKLDGVQITCGEAVVTTNTTGEFTLTNLIGSVTISISKEGYSFADIIIDSTKEISKLLDIKAKYSVSGRVMVGVNGLFDASVFVDGVLSCKTNAKGEFYISDISQTITLTFAKNGYTFGEGVLVEGPVSGIIIPSTYRVEGVVRSGDITLEGVNITTNLPEVYAITDENGHYILEGIDEDITITYTKSGFNSFTSDKINKFKDNCNASLSYNVTLNFSGLDSYSGMIISINGANQSHSENTLTKNNLEGITTISLSGGQYSFSNNTYVFNPGDAYDATYFTKNITVGLMFDVVGYVYTDKGLAVKDATVYLGSSGVYTTTDANGRYSFTGVNNKYLTIEAKLITDSCTISGTYEGATINNGLDCNITIKDYQYAYFLQARGYDYLNKSDAYQVSALGTVYPDGQNNQPVSTLYKKDNQGNRIIQNLNSGKAVVETRVALVTYVNLNTGRAKNKRVEGDKITSQTSANYSDASWNTEYSLSDYKSTYGIDPLGFHPYNVNLNTIDSSKTTKVTVDGNGNYSFTIVLDVKTNDEAYSTYRNQMKTMCDLQSLGEFFSANFAFVVGSNGFIHSLVINEEYSVKAMGLTIGTKATINYTFHTTSFHDSIPTIDPNNISNSLSFPTGRSNSIGMMQAYLPSKKEELL